MKRFFPLLVFAAGLACVAWVGAGYVRANPFALAMVVLIAAGYLAGALELRRHQQATDALAHALAGLDAAPRDLDAWTAALPEPLRHAVRLRIEGERVALPGPALTPYLTGLLVLLGMLGTFLGMVVTLNGTGAALDRASDMAAIRDVLSAPVRGLGLAFGTSVAGVAASAMLGLLSALARRERAAVTQALDARAATTLRPFTRAHRRDEAFALLRRQADSLQHQADALPRVVEQLGALVGSLERQQHALHERLLAGQGDFHARADAAHASLAASIDRSLRDGLEGSVRAAGAAIQPAVESTLAALAREATALHERLGAVQEAQLERMAGAFGERSAALVDAVGERSAALADAVGARLAATTDTLATRWHDTLTAHEAAHQRLAADTRTQLAQAAGDLATQAAAQLQALGAAQDADAARRAKQAAAQQAAWQAALDAQGRALHAQWREAGDAMAARQQAIVDALERSAGQVAAQAGEQAARTIAEISRLVEAAAEAPRAAAQVIAELREKLSESMARDNAMLDERARVLGTLGTLLDAVNRASTDQRAAIDALLAASADVLERVGKRFAHTVEHESARLADASAQAAGSVVEVASVGDAFGSAVERFGQASGQLGEQLGRIEAALAQSMARSDEQLAYYVAQAREVVDLSLLSQKQIVQELQQLRPAASA